MPNRIPPDKIEEKFVEKNREEKKNWNNMKKELDRIDSKIVPSTESKIQSSHRLREASSNLKSIISGKSDETEFRKRAKTMLDNILGSKKKKKVLSVLRENIPKSLRSATNKKVRFNFLDSGKENKDLINKLGTDKKDQFNVFDSGTVTKDLALDKSLGTVECDLGVELPRVLEKLLNESIAAEDPILSFEPSREAAIENFRTIKSFDFDLEKVLNTPSNSILSYGSKFKSPKLLKELFRNHPR